MCLKRIIVLDQQFTTNCVYPLTWTDNFAFQVYSFNSQKAVFISSFPFLQMDTSAQVSFHSPITATQSLSSQNHLSEMRELNLVLATSNKYKCKLSQLPQSILYLCSLKTMLENVVFVKYEERKGWYYYHYLRTGFQQHPG